MPTAYVTALGCRLNQAEMADLAEALAGAGWSPASEPRAADLIVFNTCAVTQEAERKVRQSIRRLRREAPKAFIVVTGCFAELRPRLDGLAASANLVLGNEAKRELVLKPQAHLPIHPVAGGEQAAPPGRTRALVRIQEGCDNRCAYCIVSGLRGPQRSRPADEVVAQVRRLVDRGYREVVLTGVHTGAYGREAGHAGPDLSGLLRRLLGETGIARLRLSSLEPWDIRAIDLALWADIRLCRHLHLPLQSGSDSVLDRMGRAYTAGEYRQLLALLRRSIPDLAVTTDVIVGFPGETEAEFADSLRFVDECGFARAHVFPYSRRPGTPAAAMPDQVEATVTKERAAAMRRVAAAAAQRYASGFVGRMMPVLWERQRAGVWSGLTSNYLKVRARHDGDLHNRITDARMERLSDGGLEATVPGD